MFKNFILVSGVRKGEEHVAGRVVIGESWGRSGARVMSGNNACSPPANVCVSLPWTKARLQPWKLKCCQPTTLCTGQEFVQQVLAAACETEVP